MMSTKNDRETKLFSIDGPIEEEALGLMTSYTIQVEAESPLQFFDRFEGRLPKRSFWGEPAADFYMVGAGEAYRISAQEDRFDSLAQEWTKLQETALVYQDSQKPGTGLTALGGMSFDPKREQDPLWQAYPEADLIVPEIMLTRHGEEAYMTTNIYLEAKHLGQNLKALHEAKRSQLLAATNPGPSRLPVVLEKSEKRVELWKASVQRAIDAIQSGQVAKIVLARELQVTLAERPGISAILAGLLDSQPTSYIFAYERGEACFLGATPERLVRLEGEELLSTCLAGTAPRGETEAEDLKRREDLFQDPKNRLEHDHVVQMIGQAMAPYCEDLHIPSTPVVKTLKNLHHLYTPVTARIREKGAFFHIIEALHPTPALGGVPREEALAFIREHEGFDRGWFGAPVGWLDQAGNGEFAVAIRSGLVHGRQVSLFAGCGVMGDSNIDEEYEETGVKFLPVLNVLEGK